MARLIVVAGLPRSGNRFLRAQIERAVSGASCVVWHGEQPLYTPTHYRYSTHIDVVIPVRNPRYCSFSMMAAGKEPVGDPTELRRKVLDFVHEVDARVHILSYEAMIDDPVAVGGELFRFLDVEPITLDVFDANAKYKEGGS